MKRVTFSADDFGLSPAVNEAVERAHRDGILDQASLMVAGAAAEDADPARACSAFATRRPASGRDRRTRGAAACRHPGSGR